jgi:hypothetical protein
MPPVRSNGQVMAAASAFKGGLMPASVRNAVSVGVLPFSLCTQLIETHQQSVRMNEYHDGTSERMALVATARRSWQMAKRLAPATLVALHDYLAARPADAFYIYVMKETVPAFTWDATGVATAGRYLVRAVGDWNQTTYIPRADSQVAFLEVA